MKRNRNENFFVFVVQQNGIFFLFLRCFDMRVECTGRSFSFVLPSSSNTSIELTQMIYKAFQYGKRVKSDRVNET